MKKGFTLVEMIVAMAIFAVVAVVALGAMLKIIDANKKAQTLQSAITNLNFSLEAMSREMRVGTQYYCGSGSYSGSAIPSGAPTCPTSGDGYLAFVSSKTWPKSPGPGTCNLIYAYRLVGSGSVYSLEKAVQPDCEDSIVAENYTPIVSDNVTITGYVLSVANTASARYPLGMIELSGFAGVRERERTYFDVQTAVSARTASQ